MDPRPAKVTLPRWLHLMYTMSWGLFPCALPISVVIARGTITDTLAVQVGIGVLLFVALAVCASVCFFVAERITKRRYGSGIGGFTDKF